MLSRLSPFWSEFGPQFYGLPLNEGTITVERNSWTVPTEHLGIVPFWAGREVSWQIKGHLYSAA